MEALNRTWSSPCERRVVTGSAVSAARLHRQNLSPFAAETGSGDIRGSGGFNALRYMQDPELHGLIYSQRKKAVSPLI